MSVSQLWPGSTIVCLACGPSLDSADVELVRRARAAGQGSIRVVAINAAIRLAPWADVRFAHHAADWCRPEDAAILEGFRGLRFAIEERAARYGADVLSMSGPDGLELENRAAVRHGKCSGYQTINVAVHLGARRIVLVGYDCKRSAAGALHWYECRGTAGASDFAIWSRHYATLPPVLKAIGVDVLNASRDTAITAFPRISLENALDAALGVAPMPAPGHAQDREARA